MKDRRRSDAAATSISLSALVVDDDDAYRAYVSALTRRLGFKVQAATDGEDALSKLETAFDLVIVDCEMPRLNGMKFMQQARSNAAIAAAYTVMLTAREDIETKIAALNCGFDDFVTKGATEVEIVAKIVSARRMAARRRMLDLTVGELYGLTALDSLTGLFNRKYFFDEAEKVLEEGAEVSIVLFDVDDLRQVNRRHGYEVGDQVLRDLAEVLNRSTRGEDVLARYNGDEFVMLLPDASGDEARGVAKRLADTVTTMRWHAGDASFGVTVTAGIATASQLEARTLSKLLSVAEH